MFPFLLSIVFIATASAQQIGKFTPEVHPTLNWETCTAAGGCAAKAGSVVLDANYRWVHTASGETCNPAGWNATLCPDAVTCSENCALEGADYEGSYNVTTTDNALTIGFAKGGARLYLMASDTQYEMFQTLNQEFTFDVDVSQLPCGINGALYFSEMPADGGLSATNVAGAQYGTGYCDSQCSPGTSWFNGTSNFAGTLGACCNEMDLWEANSAATALTPHPCSLPGPVACTGSACSNSCDPDGCDFNPFRLGNDDFYGPGLTVDTTSKFTVVTQFITDDGTSTGTLSEIRRIYVQNGVVIQNSNVNIQGIPGGNSITQSFCDVKESVFSDATLFDKFGGLAQMGESLGRGVVLVLSLWNDQTSGMLWLDGVWPAGGTAPGNDRGPCSATSGTLADPAAASVTFSNIRFGDIGSTFTSTA